MPSALQSSTATVKAIVVWNSLSAAGEGKAAAGTNHPKTEDYYNMLVHTTRFAVLWEVHLD